MSRDWLLYLDDLIESAEKIERFLLSLAASLREEGRPLPAPRSFTSAEMDAWIKEDERDLAGYRGGA